MMEGDQVCIELSSSVQLRAGNPGAHVLPSTETPKEKGHTSRHRPRCSAFRRVPSMFRKMQVSVVLHGPVSFLLLGTLLQIPGLSCHSINVPQLVHHRTPERQIDRPLDYRNTTKTWRRRALKYRLNGRTRSTSSRDGMGAMKDIRSLTCNHLPRPTTVVGWPWYCIS